MILRFSAFVQPIAVAIFWAAAFSYVAAAAPNVVVIVGDDMGYADIGVHGCKDIPTPNIDSLAASGVRGLAAGHPLSVRCRLCRLPPAVRAGRRAQGERPLGAFPEPIARQLAPAC